MDNVTARRGLAGRFAIPSLRGRGGLVAALAADSIGTGLFLPFAIVYFLHTTSLSLAVIGAGLSIARLVAVPMPMLVGPLIDRFGARETLALGNLLGGVAFVGYLFVGAAWQLVLAAFVASAAQATYWTATRSVVGLVVRPEERPSWFALQTMTRNAGYGLGGLVAVAAVGTGAHWVYQALAGANALSFGLAALLVLRWRPEPVAEPATAKPAADGTPAAAAPGYRRMLRDRALLLVTGINLAFVMCANVLTVLLVLYVTLELHEPTWIGGALFTVNTILVSTVQTFVTASTRRFSHRGILVAATLCWAVSFVILWAVSGAPRWLVVPGLFVAIVVFTLAEMLQDPIINTLVVGIAPANASGRYVATFQLSWSVGSAIAPFALTWLLTHGVALSWTVLLCVCALAVLGISRLRPAPTAGTA